MGRGFGAVEPAGGGAGGDGGRAGAVAVEGDVGGAAIVAAAEEADIGGVDGELRSSGCWSELQGRAVSVGERTYWPGQQSTMVSLGRSDRKYSVNLFATATPEGVKV